MKTPQDRMIQLVRWYLSAFHAARNSDIAKKAYNPILGETFVCHWKIPGMDDSGVGTCTVFLKLVLKKLTVIVSTNMRFVGNTFMDNWKGDAPFDIIHTQHIKATRFSGIGMVMSV